MPTRSVSTRPQALGALRAIAQALSAAVDLDTTLDLIARKTTEVMHVDSCTIYLLDQGEDVLRMRATTGLARRVLGRATLRVGEGLTGLAVAQNRPISATHAQQHPAFKYVEGAQERVFQSLLAIPLAIGGGDGSGGNRPIGALNVQTITPHDFSADEIEMLGFIGDLAAGALAKAQLYDTQRAQLEELRAVARVSEIMTSPQYLSDMLQVVTDMAAQTMQAAVVSLFLVNETHATIEFQAATRRTSPYSERAPQPLDEGVLGYVVRTGELVYIPDVAREPRFTHPERARAEGLRSLLAVPLSVRDHVTGVLCCYTSEERQFSAKQIALFSTLANQTALAIENARLVTNAAIVREMHHRIKNNLQTIAMLMQLQIPDADKLDTREVLKLNINRVRSIAAVHEVLSEQGFHMVDVKDVLTRIAQTMGLFAAPNQALRIEVYGEPIHLPSKEATSLALAVNELVQNAVEHAFIGRTAGHIAVSLGRAPDQWIVVVADDGSGLPADYRPGLGLEIVHTLIADDLRGTLTVNRPAQGTEFTIRLPRQG